MVSFFVLSTCTKDKIEKHDEKIGEIYSFEEFRKEYPRWPDSFYHLCWVFQPGEYYLLSDTVVYKFPKLDSSKIGNLGIHNKVIVIEDVHNQQDINDTTSCWYKIEYNKKKGYIFGGNIAKDTFICDIDKNGIVDYFQYRISRAASNYHFDTRKDVIIFINNKKIMTDNLNAGLNEYGYMRCYFNDCSFEQKNDIVIITLLGTGPTGIETYIFSINKLGDIAFLNASKKGTFFQNGEWIEYE